MALIPPEAAPDESRTASNLSQSQNWTPIGGQIWKPIDRFGICRRRSETEKPPEGWWLTQGAAVGLDNDQIRFSAALFSLGGVASKKNTRAARAAGLDRDRLQAFRAARSATVGRLLDEARQISEGKREPLSEEEIDWRIDNLIRSPDSLMVARGIELREKRKAAKLEARQADNEQLTIEETYRQLLKSWGPYGAPALCEMWAAGTVKPTYLWGCPFLPQLLPVIGKRFPEQIQRFF
jgi:hypothetical protein